MNFSRNGSCTQFGRRARIALCFALIPTACQSPLSGTGGTLDAQVGRLAPQIQKWHVTELAHVEPPAQGIAVNTKGDVYFTQDSSTRARILHPNGKIVTVGKGFDGPSAVAPYQSLTYVTSARNAEVDRVLANGKIQEVGSGWSIPAGVDVDSLGNIYVLDGGHFTVTRVKRNGKMSVVVPSSVCNTAVFGVSVDEDANVYVTCHASSGAVFRVEPDGVSTSLCSGWIYPVTITNDDQGNVYVQNHNASTIEECTADGKSIEIQPDEDLGVMWGIAYYNGALYVTSTRRAMIFKLTRIK